MGRLLTAEQVERYADDGFLVVPGFASCLWAQPGGHRGRHAYSLHCISATTAYPSWNWLQRPASMPLRRLDRRVPV